MANVTMRDIAEKLGVSIVSVSKALTGKEGVSEELREKVKKEADRLGYRYNLGAKGLKEGRNYNVGVIIPSYYTDDTSNAFYMKMYQCVAKCLTNYDYATMLELVDIRVFPLSVSPPEASYLCFACLIPFAFARDGLRSSADIPLTATAFGNQSSHP